jgi:hypothetical protein
MAATGVRLRTMHAPHGSSTTRKGFRSTSLRPSTFGLGLLGLFNYSHTWSHGIITNIPIEQAEKELAQSKYDIEVNTGKPCFIVAWPHGIFNGEILSLLPKTGYRIAVTYDDGMNYLNSINLYSIKRIRIFAEISPLAYAQLMDLK